MGNPYYRAGPERAARVRALFAAIAPRYDLINDLQSLGLHRVWKRRLARAVDPSPGTLALDLCCGTGDLALLLERNGARAIGLDFTLPMLRSASARAEQAGATTRFVAGDGMQLPFATASFHAVTISYGLRNLTDFAAALREMRRVTRPGGRLAILDFGRPPNAAWRMAYFAYLRLVVPLLGLAFCGDAAAYGYILESLRHYPDAAGISLLLREAGWTDIKARHLLGGVMHLHAATATAESSPHSPA